MSGSKIDERGAAVQIVRVLRDAGHTAYFAGGCVRDRLLGVEPKDYDVATDAPPDRVGGLFRDCRFVGEAFGVVLVRVASHAIEVSTFRADWGYQDGRRPDSVTFTDARNDAQRRDFTINGLFEDPLAGSDQPRIIDYVGGRDDLERRLLRAIGDPAERFGEDYLRMLRAVRIAARLGFEIEGTTADAIRNTADRLGKISRERIGQEVAWMLTPDSVGPGSGAGGSDPARSIQLMQSLHLDAQVLCEPHDEQGGCQTVERLTQSSDVAAESPGGGILGGLGGLGELADDYPVVLAVWLLDRHGFWNNPDKDASNDPADLPAVMRSWAADTLPPIVKRWRKALCLSNEQRDRLVWILRIAMELVSWETLMIAKRKRLLSMPESAGALAVMMALRHLPQIDRIAPEVYRQACELLRAGVAPTPWVTGHDLIELGIKPGRVIGRLLKQVYDAQLEGTVTDHAQALQWVRNRMCDTSLCSDGGELERE